MKKKMKRLDKALDDYLERLQDLLNNPMYEDMSNRKLNPLLRENEQTMLDALLVDEDETAALLKDDIALMWLLDFLAPIQQKFKSRKLARIMNETLDALVEIHKEGNYRHALRIINAANKVLEEK